MSDPAVHVDDSEDDVDLSRRDFIRRTAGVAAGLAGLFGIAKATTFNNDQPSGGGYGKSTYGRGTE